jgi:hypothetical protein
MATPSTFFITKYYEPVLYNDYTGTISHIPNTVQIVGKAMYSNEPEITDNKVTVFYRKNFTDNIKLGESIINQSDNTWSFTTSPLPNGLYNFYAGRMVNNQWVYSNNSYNITIVSTSSPTSSRTSSQAPVESNRFWDFLFVVLALVAGVVVLYSLYFIHNRYLQSSVDTIEDTTGDTTGDIEHIPLLLSNPNPFIRRISRDLQWWKKYDPKYKQIKQQVQKELTPQQKKQIHEMDIFTLQDINEPVLGNDFRIYDAKSLRQHVKRPYRFRGSNGEWVTGIMSLQQAVQKIKGGTDPQNEKWRKKDIARYVALLKKIKQG